MSETPDQVREWFQTALRKLWPVATGSLSLRQSPCVRTSCPACERGDGHASYALYGTDLLPGSISRCRISICGPRCRRKWTESPKSEPMQGIRSLSPARKSGLFHLIRSAPFRECGCCRRNGLRLRGRL